MRLPIHVFMLGLVLFSCSGKDPVGPDVGAVEDADTDTDTDTDTDADTDNPLDADTDEDGFSIADGDCDDGDPDIRPDADELCNSIDDDCDGDVDEDAADAGTWYADGDGDGYGDDSTALLACDPPAGTVDQGGDCDDTSGRANPGADELCDAIDNDCDELIDESDAVDADVWYIDSDGDGFGLDETAVSSCSAISGTVNIGGDCVDDDPEIHPEQADTCDGIDNDCDEEVDEDVAEDWYATSASWEEIDMFEGAFPVWIGVLPEDRGVWAVLALPIGEEAYQPAFYQHVDGLGFVRRDSFTAEGVHMDVKAATVEEDGSIWVTGRLETTPGDFSSSQVMLVRFHPDSLEVEELHYDSPDSDFEYGLDVVVTEDAVLIAGRARNTLGQIRATLWSYDGSEFSVVDSEAESLFMGSHATYNAVTTGPGGQIYLGGSRDDADGVAAAMVRGGEVDTIDELFSYTTDEEDLNDQIRDVATDAEGNLWFVGYHSEDFSLLGSVSAMFTDWRLYTGPPSGPFTVVDSFHFSLSLPSYARSVSVHPSGVVFTSGVAMDSSGGSHLIVRAGNPPVMFTSLDSLRSSVPSLPSQGTYARNTAFERDGTVWLIEGWQSADVLTETGEPTFNTQMWRMSCL
jgi:hypothetical protein